MAALIRRSNERSAELARRGESRREARWYATIALNQVPENDLGPPRRWQLRAWLQRFVRMREARQTGGGAHGPAD